MRCGVLTTVLAALAVSGPSASAAEKIDLKILYAGNPGSPRAKDFISFLGRHFARVGETNYEKFKPAAARGFDVVIFDWTSIYPRGKDGKITPKFTNLHSPTSPNLSGDFDRPAVLIGAAGGSLAGRLRLKIDWL
jgi:hypothetical protein